MPDKGEEIVLPLVRVGEQPCGLANFTCVHADNPALCILFYQTGYVFRVNASPEWHEALGEKPLSDIVVTDCVIPYRHDSYLFRSFEHFQLDQKGVVRMSVADVVRATPHSWDVLSSFSRIMDFVKFEIAETLYEEIE